MATILKVPALGEDVDSVDVVRVLVEVGDVISSEQPVIEVETEKASVEVPSELSGRITELHVSIGDTLAAGAPILTIEEAEQEKSAVAVEEEPAEVGPEQFEDVQTESLAEPEPTISEEERPQPKTMVVPELGEGVDSVDVIAVHIEVGATVELNQPVMEVETEKAAVEVPSTIAGTVTEVYVKVGDTINSGDPIVDVLSSGGVEPVAGSPSQAHDPADQENEIVEEESSASAQPGTPPPVTGEQELLAPLWSVPESPRALVPAAPTVRRFAREIGADIAQVGGSGPGGRISIDDVKAHAARTMAQLSAGSNAVSQPSLPDFAVWGPVRREPMTKIRQVTARNMARAWVQVPQVTNNDWADITRLEEMRKQYRARVEAAGGKLTITSMLVRVVASALKAFPNLNSSVDMEGHEVIHKDYVHVGVAVDTDRGLLVPVIRDADTKNMTAISVELDDLAGRARKRKLRPEEMQGGSFSISNLGGIGGTGFSPIVNWPEVAILGVSRGLVEPRLVDGVFEPRLILPLSLSYDHRLVDGAEAARFLRWVAEALEQPLLLALEG